MRTLMSLFTILVMVFCQGCGFSKLKQDLKQLETVSTISGTIICESPRKKPIFIGLLSIDKELLRYNIKYKSGHYEFFVLPGTYYIAAFEDANEDFTFQHDEYVGAYGSPDPIKVAAGSNIDTINVTLLSPEKAKLAMPELYKRHTKAVKIEAKNVHFGEIVKINDPRFSIENAKIGLWEPFRFINEVGWGIFFMEPYNPKKIPMQLIPSVWSATALRSTLSTMPTSVFSRKRRGTSSIERDSIIPRNAAMISFIPSCSGEGRAAMSRMPPYGSTARSKTGLICIRQRLKFGF